jgi:hypothetical protein
MAMLAPENMSGQKAAAITDRLRVLGFEAEEKSRAVSGIEQEAARLWAEVIDSKVYKVAGFSSLAEYMEEIQTPYTRGYVYNLADCARCQPVIDRYEELGPKSAITIAKAVKELVTQAKEENAPELTPLQELIEEKESLLMEEARIKARLKDIKARVEELESDISDLTGGD